MRFIAMLRQRKLCFHWYLSCIKPLSPSLGITIVELQLQEQQQQTRPLPAANWAPSVLFSPYRPSWNLGLGSCFGAIHGVNCSDLWMIKFLHCQSPFLPGTNTSDIGAKARGSREWPACCGSPDHRQAPGGVLHSNAPRQTRTDNDFLWLSGRLKILYS